MSVGVIIGRFQVPTLTSAHQELIKEVKGKVTQPVIFLGVSRLDGRVREHPYSFDQRVQIIRETYQKIPIFPLLDRRDDEEWTLSIENLIDYLYPEEQITIFVGSNSDVPYCFKSERFTLKELPVQSQSSGTATRNGIIPHPSRIFREGQAYALAHQFPSVHPTVDIAMVKDDNTVLLIKRRDTGAWCFPGGFVDLKDSSLEKAAQREFTEETGISIEHSLASLTYLGSFPIKDWRYRRCRQDSILTTLFLTTYTYGSLNYFAKTEVQEMKWVHMSELLDYIAVEHEPLAKRVFEVLSIRLL